MIMQDNPSTLRYDFRCNLCRQKNVFHCEHDTPYRDVFLGINDENTSGPSLIHAQNLKTQNKKINKKKQGKANGRTQPQDKKHVNTTNAKPVTQTPAHPVNQPTKSCTIL